MHAHCSAYNPDPTTAPSGSVPLEHVGMVAAMVFTINATNMITSKLSTAPPSHCTACMAGATAMKAPAYIPSCQGPLLRCWPLPLLSLPVAAVCLVVQVQWRCRLGLQPLEAQPAGRRLCPTVAGACPYPALPSPASVALKSLVPLFVVAICRCAPGCAVTLQAGAAATWGLRLGRAQQRLAPVPHRGEAGGACSLPTLPSQLSLRSKLVAVVVVVVADCRCVL